MEVQRNKKLNRAFIVLAVLAVVLRLASMVSRVGILGGVQVSYLLNVACVLLPILTIACSKRKAASVTLTVLYFIVYGVMTWMTVDAKFYGWWLRLLLSCDGLIISTAIGIFPLLNATCKEKSKRPIAIVCLILGGGLKQYGSLLHSVVLSMYFSWKNYTNIITIRHGAIGSVKNTTMKSI